MNEIIKAQSEYEALKERIAALREEIASLTAERDELLYQECPRIKAEFESTIGAAYVEFYSAKSRLAQLRRAIEIFQAARNRQQKKDAEEAQKEARDAYKDYEEKIKEDARRVKEAEEFRKREQQKEEEWQRTRGAGAEGGAGKKKDSESKAEKAEDDSVHSENKEPDSKNKDAENTTKKDAGNSESDEEDETFKTREEALKYYHRKLVKLLHPDANPDQSQEDKDLFHEMEKAFKEGDLDRLVEIYEYLRDRDAEKNLSDTPEDVERLREIASALEKKRDDLLAEIRKIKSEFPYTAKALLENEEERTKVLNELANGVKLMDKEYQKLLKRFNRLKEGKDPDGDD